MFPEKKYTPEYWAEQARKFALNKKETQRDEKKKVTQKQQQELLIKPTPILPTQTAIHHNLINNISAENHCFQKNPVTVRPQTPFCYVNADYSNFGLTAFPVSALGNTSPWIKPPFQAPSANSDFPSSQSFQSITVNTYQDNYTQPTQGNPSECTPSQKDYFFRSSNSLIAPSTPSPLSSYVQSLPPQPFLNRESYFSCVTPSFPPSQYPPHLQRPPWHNSLQTSQLEDQKCRWTLPQAPSLTDSTPWQRSQLSSCPPAKNNPEEVKLQPNSTGMLFPSALNSNSYQPNSNAVSSITKKLPAWLSEAILKNQLQKEKDKLKLKVEQSEFAKGVEDAPMVHDKVGSFASKFHSDSEGSTESEEVNEKDELLPVTDKNYDTLMPFMTEQEKELLNLKKLKWTVGHILTALTDLELHNIVNERLKEKKICAASTTSIAAMLGDYNSESSGSELGTEAKNQVCLTDPPLSSKEDHSGSEESLKKRKEENRKFVEDSKQYERGAQVAEERYKERDKYKKRRRSRERSIKDRDKIRRDRKRHRYRERDSKRKENR